MRSIQRQQNRVSKSGTMSVFPVSASRRRKGWKGYEIKCSMSSMWYLSKKTKAHFSITWRLFGTTLKQSSAVVIESLSSFLLRNWRRCNARFHSYKIKSQLTHPSVLNERENSKCKSDPVAKLGDLDSLVTSTDTGLTSSSRCAGKKFNHKTWMQLTVNLAIASLLAW